ncbi:transcriptional repressor [Cytophagaceae bacterium ABcell3]|nr:transcriptional repressor [Cytophagaceae bacterium ABcell3]
MTSTAKKILKNNKIKVTSTRVMVLDEFLKASKVLTLQEISGKLPENFDRVTLYRTLNTFESGGIIHKIPDHSGQVNYALCNHDCNHEHHNDDHVHFKCTNCNTTLCLDQVKAPEIKLNENFKISRYNYLVEGICEKCNK